MGWAEGNLGDHLRDGDPRALEALRRINRQHLRAVVEGCMRKVQADDIDPPVWWMLEMMEHLDHAQEEDR